MKNILKDKKFYIILLVVLVFFGIFVSMNYSVDTYLLLASPKMMYVREFITAGRIITAVFFFSLGVLHVPHYFMYLLSFILAVFCSTMAIYELNRILDKYVTNKLLSLILATIIIINPFIIELWLFIETGIMMLSILSCVEAFKYFEEYVSAKEKDRKLLKKALCWMFVALFAYQGTVALFIALCLIPIAFKAKDFKEFVKYNIFALGLYGIPTVVNYILVILTSTKRVGSSYNLMATLKTIMDTTFHQLLNGFGLFPRGFISGLLFISIIIVLYYIYKAKERTRLLCSLFYVLVMVYFFTIAPVLPQNSDTIVFFPRTAYAFGSIFGLLFILINKKANNHTLIFISLILLVVEFVSFNRIEIDRYIVNYEDKQIVLQVEEKVKEYEESTGIEVKNLAIYNQQASKKFYSGLEDNINVCAKNEQPSGTALYVYYTNRKVQLADKDEEVEKAYFNNKHWKNFSLDQVVIKGNTIHWYLY